MASRWAGALLSSDTSDGYAHWPPAGATTIGVKKEPAGCTTIGVKKEPAGCTTIGVDVRDLSTASEGEIQWALRGPLFQSHRISVTGSAATSVQPRSQHQNPDDQVSVRVRARLKVGAYRVRFS